MRKFTVPVDLLNPGQVFASLGLVEAIEMLSGHYCESNFVSAISSNQAIFEIHSEAPRAPIADVLRFLGSSELRVGLREVSALRME